MQLVASGNVTVSYQVASRKRYRCPPKAPERQALLCPIPQGRRAIGTCVNVEFFDEESKDNATRWYKGTIICYNRHDTL